MERGQRPVSNVRVTDSPALRTSDLLICRRWYELETDNTALRNVWRQDLNHAWWSTPVPPLAAAEGERFLETLAETAASVNQARYAEYRAALA